MISGFWKLICSFYSRAEFTQNPHKLLVIPGPIEVSDEVLLANASASVSHVSAGFIAIFGDTLKMLLRLLYTSVEAGSQAFVVSGSGTLGWDMVAANLVERGERVLVLSNGYFGDAFRDCLEVYGAEVEVLSAQLGHTITPSELEKHLQEAKQTYKLITITHCDTSTGVLADAKGLAAVASRISPDSLLVLDSVCSVASEEIRLDDWKLDVVLSASQKGLGTPPGLCIFVASSRALKTLDCRQSPPGSYYASWKKWLPSGSPSCFFFLIQSQPKAHWLNLSLLSHESLSGWLTGLFCYPALHKSLKTILESPNLSLEERFLRHKQASKKVKEAVKKLGLKELSVNDESSAHGMTAIYLPESIKPGEVMGKMLEKDLVIAGGLHKDCKDRYVRIGHMGLTAVDDQRAHIDRIIDGFSDSLKQLGHHPVG
ncbi:hypothetical protein PGT21_018391 [Puccinia graminis f. sp. tritici]|uniref:alanine--glyoxylate transaminase n=1 Tax=Puccinia graminis f. sp. tritici TaxID=56615 RepID=A0A5B0PGA0_PUCGR|nr:hypothetical protein PGT21_018391 [Puccinia graminis f. sp. tritici]